MTKAERSVREQVALFRYISLSWREFGFRRISPKLNHMITSVGSGGSKKDVFASSIRERGQETTELKTAAGEAEARVCPVVQPPRPVRM